MQGKIRYSYKSLQMPYRGAGLSFCQGKGCQGEERRKNCRWRQKNVDWLVGRKKEAGKGGGLSRPVITQLTIRKGKIKGRGRKNQIPFSNLHKFPINFNIYLNYNYNPVESLTCLLHKSLLLFKKKSIQSSLQRQGASRKKTVNFASSCSYLQLWGYTEHGLLCV